MDNIVNQLSEITEILEKAISEQSWEAVQAAYFKISGKEIVLPETTVSNDIEPLVRKVIDEMYRKKTNATQESVAVKSSNKKKAIKNDTVEDVVQDANKILDKPATFGSERLIVQKSNYKTPNTQGPVGFKNNYKPTKITTDIFSSEQQANESVASQTNKEYRGEVKPFIVTCKMCNEKFDFHKVYPIGIVKEHDQSRCDKCQLKRG
jgi:hypothetical protein